jgi:lycopene cyclase domain-containing protein
MYTVLAVVAVGLASIVDQLVLTTNLLRRKAFWTAYAIVFGFQLLTNGVLTGVPVVRYNPADITGVRFVYAPIEDLLFGFSMVLFTLSVWVWAGRRDAARARP